MVAITVILAAVIAAFVLDIGDSMGSNAPTANFDWEQDGDDTVYLEHTGGDPVEIDNLKIVAGSEESTRGGFDDGWTGDEISAGDRLEITDDLSGSSSITGIDGDTVQLVWETDGGESQVLTEYEME